MEKKLIKDINAKWKDYRLTEFGKLDESTGNHLSGIFYDLYITLEDLKTAAIITNADLNKMDSAVTYTKKIFLKILKGKGLKGW